MTNPYYKVITRRERLKELLSLRAPECLLREERRLIQEAVDECFSQARLQEGE